MSVETLVKSLLDMKGVHVVRFEMHSRELLDEVILVSAQNTVHLNALVDATEKHFGKNAAYRLSGKPESGWMVVDGGATVIHVLLETIRLSYELDTLFSKRGIAYHH